MKDTDIGERFELRLLRSATGSVVAEQLGAEAAAAQMGNTREIAETHDIHKHLDVELPDRHVFSERREARASATL